MDNKFIFPLRIMCYDEELAQEIRKLNKKLREDELLSEHGEDPKVLEYLNSQRPKAVLYSTKEYIGELESIFSPDDAESFDKYMEFGGISLKKEEIERISKTITTKNTNSKKGLSI